MEKDNNNYTMTIKFFGKIKDFDEIDSPVEWIVPTNPQESLKDLFSRFFKMVNLEGEDYRFYYNNNPLDKDSIETVAQVGLINGSRIEVSLIVRECFIAQTNVLSNAYNNNVYNNNVYNNINNNIINKKQFNYKIYIKFLRLSNYSAYNCYTELKGILKLCLLKEIAIKIDNTVLQQLRMMKKIPEIIYYIIKTLKESRLDIEQINNVNQNIKGIMEQEDGRNIFRFSNFVDENINYGYIKLLASCLHQIYKPEINDISFRLGKYEKYLPFLEFKFQEAMRNSYFEFSIVSLVIIDRPDFDTFSKERHNCPNRSDLLLFHGTQIHPITCILTGLFKKSIDKCIQHGQGVYFTDLLDNCWFYGGDVNNRYNKNKIPAVGDMFTGIVSLVYFNRQGFLKVNNYNTRLRPGKNEINFAYAGPVFETLPNPDFRKFVGTEYVVWDLNQICPFMSVKFRREEYCIIWRDDNFSKKDIFHNQFDQTFKSYLQERLKYVNQSAKYNVYKCESTDEAIKLVIRKKYNKIILLSNVGKDYGGKLFVDQARQILGNNVIVLFLAFNINHLNWITKYKNALFSKDPEFFEEYLDSFDNEWKFRNLITKIENKYGVKFNIDNNFLNFPLFRAGGHYSDLIF